MTTLEKMAKNARGAPKNTGRASPLGSPLQFDFPKKPIRGGGASLPSIGEVKDDSVVSGTAKAAAGAGAAAGTAAGAGAGAASRRADGVTVAACRRRRSFYCCC